MGAISVTREGEGPEILLVHGGASPDATWGALAPLAARWTLASVHRRGYPPSPPMERGQDFAADAADISPLRLASSRRRPLVWGPRSLDRGGRKAGERALSSASRAPRASTTGRYRKTWRTAFVARTAVRIPGEARPELESIRKAAVPCLVASGDHTPAMERICDALADALDAQRLVAPGAGHFVAAAPGFAEQFERFLLAQGTAR